MAEKRRRFFQIHLSTCVVLMFVAGALVWENLGVNIIVFRQPTPEADGLGQRKTGLEVGASLGWPARICYYGNGMFVSEDNVWGEVREQCGQILYNRMREHNFSEQAVGANIAAALGVLAIVAFLAEAVLRRRERQAAMSRLPRLRFSLRTLVIAVLLVGSGLP
jgi:hypothetical protein